jgi:hypothetical protein
MSLEDEIRRYVADNPGLSDRELTNALRGQASPQQAVNQACRSLEAKGAIARKKRHDGKLGNYPTGAVPDLAPDPAGVDSLTDALTEDELKKVLKAWLEGDGWSVEVAWGGAHGVDIAARRNEELWLIEVKGRGSRPPMRVNYFLAILGETLQRMSDSTATYSIALPDLPPFRKLWDRLPALAKERTHISALFVSDSGEVIWSR